MSAFPLKADLRLGSQNARYALSQIQNILKSWYASMTATAAVPAKNTKQVNLQPIIMLPTTQHPLANPNARNSHRLYVGMQTG